MYYFYSFSFCLCAEETVLHFTDPQIDKGKNYLIFNSKLLTHKLNDNKTIGPICNIYTVVGPN